MALANPVVRLTALIKRKPSMPLDDFHQTMLMVRSQSGGWLGGIDRRTSSLPMLEYDAAIAIWYRQRDLSNSDILDAPYVLKKILPADFELFALGGTFCAE